MKNFAEPPQTFFFTPAVGIRNGPSIFKRTYRFRKLSTATWIIPTNIAMTHGIYFWQTALNQWTVFTIQHTVPA
jgi:hypothetical protein